MLLLFAPRASHLVLLPCSEQKILFEAQLLPEPKLGLFRNHILALKLERIVKISLTTVVYSISPKRIVKKKKKSTVGHWSVFSVPNLRAIL